MKLLAPLAALFTVVSLAQPPAFPEKVRILRKGGYRVEVRTASRTGDWEGWWGASNDFPGESTVVSGVRVFFGGERLNVPVSAFAGLADMHTLWLDDAKGGIVLRAIGSDAGDAWKGVFRFDRRGIVERRVRSGEFPDIDFERTVYRRPRLGEIE